MQASPPSNAPSALPPELTRWRELILDAGHRQQKLNIQGGRTKAFYGEQVTPGAAVLDTRSHSGITAYEPSELVVTVRAGTPLGELEDTLAAQGQCLPFEPPHFGPGATVGGMVAAGLSGPSRASVGSVRDYVLGLQLLNGRGEHLTFGGQVMKNVAGYDVSRLLAGSLGCLGVITDVSLKVLSRAPREATLRFELDQSSALQQLARWRGQPLPLNASCWVRDETVTGSPEQLYVRLRGAVAAVDAACQRMLKDAPGQVLDATAVAPDWSACGEQSLPFFQAPDASLALWRLSVAPTAPVLDLPRAPLVEWHGGQRWVWAAPTDAEQLRNQAQRGGGHATLFRVPPNGNAPGVARFTSPEPALLTIQQRLMAEFDPAGVFRTGRWGF